MQRLIKATNIFLILLVAPVIGVFLAFYDFNPSEVYDSKAIAPLSVQELAGQIAKVKLEGIAAVNLAGLAKVEVDKILILANKNNLDYLQQQKEIEQLTAVSEQQANKSNIVLEQILSNLLGEPIAIHQGKLSTIKIYTLKDAGYQGYMAKVTPHSPEALKLVMANDQLLSKGETTSHAAERLGAILAVNAGGFIRTKEGMITPLGTTVVDGKIQVLSSDSKLSFVGLNNNGHLVGGKFLTEEEIYAADISQGSSFRPTLLQNGIKIELNGDELITAKHPRTIIGNFSNNDLLVMVIDGRRNGWSTGVTLTEIQDKLLSFKIKDAFNLDGGGSSTFVYNGVVLNKPSDGIERPVASNLVILP